jgi:hypothetical protein
MPSAAEAAVDLRALTARLEAAPFQSKSKSQGPFKAKSKAEFFLPLLDISFRAASSTIKNIYDDGSRWQMVT